MMTKICLVICLITEVLFNPLKHSSTKNGSLNRAWFLHGGTKNEPLRKAPVHIQHNEPDCEPPFSGLLGIAAERGRWR